MEWQDNSATKPGFTLLEADDPDNPGHHYVIQRKDAVTGPYRLAYRSSDTEALRIIYTDNTEDGCKQYAETYKGRQ